MVFHDPRSPRERIAALGPRALAHLAGSLEPQTVAALDSHWEYLARTGQWGPASDWEIWLILAGRGFGKTRAGAEWVLNAARAVPGARIALLGATVADARAVMVEGESGVLARAPQAAGVTFEPSLRRLRWENSSTAWLFSAAEPEALRGPQFHFAWGDEAARWPDAASTLASLRLALRLGAHPQLVLTTTPRPLPWLKAMTEAPGVIVTRGTTQDNSANLSSTFLRSMARDYGGTQLGRQELGGEIIDDIEGALWTRAMLEACRVRILPPLRRTVVAVDPPATSGARADACGIAVMDMAVQGFVAGRAGTVRTQFEPLLEIADLTFVDDGSALVVASGPPATSTPVDDKDLGAALPGKQHAQRTDHRAAAATISDCITVGFSDPARDYQFGLQRAVRRNPATHARQLDLAASLDPGSAKRLAEQVLARSIARRTTADITLPWRYAQLRVGDVIVAGQGGQPWRIRRSTCVGMVFELAVEAVPAAVASGMRSADGGRPPATLPPPAGPTTLHVLDLPPLAAALPTTPRLWLAAAGASAGWQRADALVSADAGDSYAVAATIGLPTIMGQLLAPLAKSAEDRWNRSDSVEIGLLETGMWLESRTFAAVLAGANLALIGDEIVQFTTAEAIAPGRFRLSGWLRGRRATVAVAHAAGARFVLLDTDRMAAFDPPPEAIGTTLRWKAAGPGDDLALVTPADAVIVGRALLPPAPVHFSATRTTNGDWLLGWTRRSRAGFGWPDGADAPLAEETEAYDLDVHLDGRSVRKLQLGAAAWLYPAAAFAADGGARALRLQAFVAQRSAIAGQGAASALEIALGNG